MTSGVRHRPEWLVEIEAIAARALIQLLPGNLIMDLICPLETLTRKEIPPR
jgi:hypothetical protein